MTSERMIMLPDWLVEEAASLIEQAGLVGTGVSLAAERLRAVLAQPAAGEPVAFSTEHGVLFWNGSPEDWKGKPVQLYLAPPAAAHGVEPGTVRVTADWLKAVHRDLDACQKVIWLAGCRPRVPGGFDPAYCEDAQARLKEIDEHIARAQGDGGEV